MYAELANHLAAAPNMWHAASRQPAGDDTKECEVSSPFGFTQAGVELYGVTRYNMEIDTETKERVA